ncbi:MAG: hypothetical protein JWR83_2748 [Aeromicrobium sp.]|nr:hypothetical protein [Aeromicrobium sp.]
MNSEYEFRSRWLIGRSRESLWDVLESLLASDNPMPWWPSVQVTSYDKHSLDLRARSRLGYALKFRLSDLRSVRPTQLTFASHGELRGTGLVTFDDLGPLESAMDIDWRVSTDKAWMRRTTWLLRPVFVLGHNLVMRQGEKQLNAWLRAN